MALLSPCSALLLPAFFAYAFQSRRQLTARTALFYLGLVTVFVPLGTGAALATALFVDHRGSMILVAGVLLVALGVAELAGRSLSFVRLGSGLGEASGLLGTYSLGLVYGFGGFCSGPILGSVLTVAATDGNPLRGGGLLAVYALGTTVPLFLLAALWDSLGIGGRRWLRGRGLTLGPLTVHSTNVIAGSIFILLGLSFVFFRGTTSLSGLYERWGFTDISFEADREIKRLLSPTVDIVVAAALAGAAAAAGWRLRPRLRRLGSVGDEFGGTESGDDAGDALPQVMEETS